MIKKIRLPLLLPINEFILSTGDAACIYEHGGNCVLESECNMIRNSSLCTLCAGLICCIPVRFIPLNVLILLNLFMKLVWNYDLCTFIAQGMLFCAIPPLFNTLWHFLFWPSISKCIKSISASIFEGLCLIIESFKIM